MFRAVIIAEGKMVSSRGRRNGLSEGFILTDSRRPGMVGENQCPPISLPCEIGGPQAE